MYILEVTEVVLSVCLFQTFKMDFLKAEIERKKRQIAEKNVMAPEKKYFKRGDLAAVQQKEYLAKYGPKKDDIEELAKIRRKSLEEKGIKSVTFNKLSSTLN